MKEAQPTSEIASLMFDKRKAEQGKQEGLS